MQPTHNLRVVRTRRLRSPADLKTELPMTERTNSVVVDGRATVQRILRREDPRLLDVESRCFSRGLAGAVKNLLGFVEFVAGPQGSRVFLPRLVGLSRASEMILTARDIRADEAERIGLVSRILPADDFEAGVADYAAKLASGPPFAMTISKRLLQSSLDAPLLTQLRDEISGITQCFTTRDVTEAITAFNEKRKPVFTGE